MKSFDCLLLAVLLTGACIPSSHAQPQTLPADLTAVDFNLDPTQVSAWWDVADFPFTAPCPQAPPGAELYYSPELGTNEIFFSYDDTDGASGRSMAGMAQFAPINEFDGDNGQPLLSFPSNSLWLELVSGTVTTNSASFVVHTPQPGIFDLFYTTNFSTPQWYWVARGLPGQTNFAIWIPSASKGFFVAGSTNGIGLDQYGLTSAYYALVGGTNTFGEDLRGSGMSDIWQIENFGDLSQSPTNDYDGSGVSNLTDYEQGIEPNVISFTVTTTNQYVDNQLAPLLITVSGGVPAAMAELVDSTNFATASWGNYSPNPVVDLSAVEGWHQVWIGLRGRMATSQQTWQMARVKLMLTPPLLVITNPVSSTVSQPTIQLQGYCSSRVAALNYTLANAAGVASNQPVFVLDEAYDTNNFEFTTNYFQAFDVPLALGSNTFTLYATDLAGNTTVTNFALTLDYSGKTNPPVLTVGWPQEGTKVGSGTFTCRGLISDPTAQVSAQIIGTNGPAATVTGRVGRDGSFWLENLPLNPGTNVLVVTANDAAGNSSSNTVNVVQGDVTLTVDSADIVAEYAQGTVSDPTCTVWVNGMQAESLCEGCWEIWGLNLNLNNTVVQARAIPNSDNGGSGTGGGTNGGVGSPDVGNPSSPSATDAEMELPWPDGVVYAKTVHLSQYNYWQNNAATSTALFQDKTAWAETSGGTGTATYVDTGPPYQETDATTWPGGLFPIFPDGSMTDSANGTSTTVDPPFVESDLWFYHDVDYSGPGEPSGVDSYVLHYHDDEEMVLLTGGAPGATGTALYAISAQDVTVDPWTGLPSAAVLLNTVDLDNFGTLDTNGTLWAMLPVHSQVVLAPRLLGPPLQSVTSLGPEAKLGPYAALLLGSQPYQLHILANGIDLSTNTPKFCVGQKVTFQSAWSPSLPGLLRVTNLWNFGGDFVNESNQPCENCSVNWTNDPSMLTNNTATAWWTSGSHSSASAVYPAKLTQTLTFSNGFTTNLTVQGLFSMYRPGLTNYFLTNNFQIMVAHSHAYGSNPGLNDKLGAFYPPEYYVSVDSASNGNAGITQLVNGYATNQCPEFDSTYGSNALDTVEFTNYSGYNMSGSVVAGDLAANQLHFIDGQYIQCIGNTVEALEFIDFIRFKPAGAGSIYVTLGAVHWGLSGYTAYSNVTGSIGDYQSFTTCSSPGCITPPIQGTQHIDSQPTDSEQFPTWQNILTGTPDFSNCPNWNP